MVQRGLDKIQIPSASTEPGPAKGLKVFFEDPQYGHFQSSGRFLKAAGGPFQQVYQKIKWRIGYRYPAWPLMLSWNNKKNSDSEWVFPSRKQTAGHVQWFQRSFNKARAHSGLEDVTMHDLCRTAASHMTAMGVSRLVVAKILRHAEQGVTRVYDRHGYDAEKRAALEKWTARLEQILSGKQVKVVNLR